MSEYKFKPDPSDHELVALMQQDNDAKQTKPSKTAVQPLVQRLIDARLQKKCSQTILAEKAGIPQSALARIESGKVSPTLKTLSKLAEALDMQLTLLRK